MNFTGDAHTVLPNIKEEDVVVSDQTQKHVLTGAETLKLVKWTLEVYRPDGKVCEICTLCPVEFSMNL